MLCIHTVVALVAMLRLGGGYRTIRRTPEEEPERYTAEAHSTTTHGQEPLPHLEYAVGELHGKILVGPHVSDAHDDHVEVGLQFISHRKNTRRFFWGGDRRGSRHNMNVKIMIKQA